MACGHVDVAMRRWHTTTNCSGHDDGRYPLLIDSIRAGKYVALYTLEWKGSWCTEVVQVVHESNIVQHGSEVERLSIVDRRQERRMMADVLYDDRGQRSGIAIVVALLPFTCVKLCQLVWLVAVISAKKKRHIRKHAITLQSSVSSIIPSSIRINPLASAHV